MTESHVSRDFWKRFTSLPVSAQERAREAYALWQKNPRHPGLHFKRVSQRQPIWSARVGRHHRALALWKEGEPVWWFWIGTQGSTTPCSSDSEPMPADTESDAVHLTVAALYGDLTRSLAALRESVGRPIVLIENPRHEL